MCLTHLRHKCQRLAISQKLFPSHRSETYPYFSCSQWCHLHQVYCSESKHSSCQDWKRMHTISAAGLLISRQINCYAHNPLQELRTRALHNCTPAFGVKGLWWMEIVSSGEQCLMATLYHSLGEKKTSVVSKQPFYKLFLLYLQLKW